MALQDKLACSSLSLAGNGFDPKQKTPSWGFKNPTITDSCLNPLDPKLSALHYTYDVNSVPSCITISNFNKSTIYPSSLPKESILDELDASSLAPKNLQVGTVNSVVSQRYKSSTNCRYQDIGPKGGFYTT